MVTTAVSDSQSSIFSPDSLATLIVTDGEEMNEFLSTVAQSLQSSGLATESLSLCQAASLETLAKHSVVLLDASRQSLLLDISDARFQMVQKLLESANCIIWITGGGGRNPSNPNYGLVTGLCRVCRQENPKVSIVTVALDDSTGRDHLSVSNADRTAEVLKATLPHLADKSFEPEYREIDETFQVNRLYEAEEVNNHIFERTLQPTQVQEWSEWPPKKLSIKVTGLLDMIEFIEDETLKRPLEPNELLIEVKAIGLNFKDCLTLLGRVNSDDLGSDCSGVVAAVGSDCGDFQVGDRVLTGTINTYKSFVRPKKSQVYKIADSMSYIEAAAIPTAYSTAYYCLHKVARLQKNEFILIHAAAGGTGQAAVQMALDLGAEVFAAVGSSSKKQLLMDKFGIPADHIFYSRDLSFADGIRRMTEGRGVDIVLNSLSGDALVASWECIATFGRFVEIGRKDIDTWSSLPMAPFIRNASFSGVDLAIIMENASLCQELMSGFMGLINSGRIQLPDPITTYPISEIEQAFRFLQSGKSTGKIVLSVSGHDQVPVSKCAQV